MAGVCSAPLMGEQIAGSQTKRQKQSFNLGGRITRLRCQQGLSRQELADRSGISQQTLRKIELGKQSPRIMLLQEILSVLGSSFDHLLSMEEQSNRFSRRSITRVRQRRDAGQYQQLLNADLLHKKMQPTYTHLPAFSWTNVSQEVSFGEVFVMVLSGKISLHLTGSTVLSLEAGDCGYFDAGKTFRIENLARGNAGLLTLLARK